MKKQTYTLLLLFCFMGISAQNEKKNFKIVSYNVENYFDTVNDSLKNDEEYLPGGMRGWNFDKYKTKQNNISKVISSIGGWEIPAIVGLCEIESEKAMSDLTKYSPLKNLNYKYIHYESPDARGIDVALLYQPQLFKPHHSEPIRINFPDKAYKTRDILYAAGTLPNRDTLNVFVCHFPSRLGGELESEDRRKFVAQTLRNKIDSIIKADNTPNIVIMGDFNDYPSNVSITDVLQAKPLTTDNISATGLYNLAYKLQGEGKGSHKFQSEWGMLDQIIVSGNLLNPENTISTTQDNFRVYEANFLLENDDAFLGKRPKRTYVGMSYAGGFSDHLPVFVDLWY